MRSLAVIAAITLALSGCETAAPPNADDPAGIRREPCGGGPVFPPEESDAQQTDGDAAPAIQE